MNVLDKRFAEEPKPNLIIHFIASQELQEFWPLKLLFEALLKKLSYTASLELVPLMEIPGVKQVYKFTIINEL